MTSLLRRVLPTAFAAAAFFIALPHAPARADTGAAQPVCGNVNLTAATSSEAAKAFDCFTTAFTHCEPATLVATGTDAGSPVKWTFTTVDGGVDYGCSVAETMDRGNPGATTTDTYLCRTVKHDKDGALIFGGCGAQRDVALRVADSGAGQTSAAATPANPGKN